MKYLITQEETNSYIKEFSEKQKAFYFTENDYWSFSFFDLRDIEYKKHLFDAVRAVFAICEDENNNLLLVNDKKRGWEFPGGHLNKEELLKRDLNAALTREVLEESGYDINIKTPILAAIIHNKKPAINKDLDCPYPERSVMMYYSGDIKNKISEVNDEEIMESEIFSYEKLKNFL